MTDDRDTYKVFQEFQKYHLMPVTPGLDGILRDFSILMNTKVIVHHCELAWSAYSHIASLLRETPIINTYPNLSRNIAEILKKYDGWPSNFYNYSDLEKLYNDFLKNII